MRYNIHWNWFSEKQCSLRVLWNEWFRIMIVCQSEFCFCFITIVHGGYGHSNLGFSVYFFIFLNYSDPFLLPLYMVLYYLSVEFQLLQWHSRSKKKKKRGEFGGIWMGLMGVCTSFKNNGFINKYQIINLIIINKGNFFTTFYLREISSIYSPWANGNWVDMMIY